MQPVYDAVGTVAGVTTTLPQGVDTQVFCTDSQDRLTWAGSAGTPPCSSTLTPGDSGSLAGTGASYSASYTYDAGNRLRSGPLGNYSYTNNSHVDAATAIGGSAWTAAYDASGDLTCDTAGQLATWQNAPSNPTAAKATFVAWDAKKAPSPRRERGLGVRPLLLPLSPSPQR